jgi:transposase-like protein
VLVELKLVEQRYRAVIDVLDGMSVTDVARSKGVARQSLHSWLRHSAEGGMAATRRVLHPFREGRSVRESVGMGLVNQSGNLHGLRSMLPPSPSRREVV